ncbi:SpoIIE family protein phosphatase [Streptomyces albidoflavus]|uniref:SpoIIE family protein phosphatase n=1 Tax=Streptomyces albidoflavus TaxID=1886 RepID=UPI0033BF8B10
MAVPDENPDPLAEALLHTLASQSSMGLFLFDDGLDLVRYHADQLLTALGEEAGKADRTLFRELLDDDARHLMRKVRDDLEARHGYVTWRPEGHGERELSFAALPLRDPDGRPGGVAAAVVDITGEIDAFSRYDTLQRGDAIGSSLDVARIAQELADTAALRLADTVTVDVLDSVLQGRLPHPGHVRENLLVRRISAGVPEGERFPAAFPLGGRHGFPHAGPFARALDERRSQLVREAGDDDRWLALAVERGLAPPATRSLIVVPLTGRGALLGLATFYRGPDSEPFSRKDLATADALVQRAGAVADNARLYTVERAAAQLLRHRLIPGALKSTATVQSAEGYVANGGHAWCEVVALPGARTALVVGDIAASGVRGAAHMGQLRASLLALAEADLEPGELLSRLAALTSRLSAQDKDASGQGESAFPLATCLYLVYDPLDHSCVVASAGHPAPLCGEAGGELGSAAIEIGPPLGVEYHAYESTRFSLPEHGELALYTDGLTSVRPGGQSGPVALAQALASARGSLEEQCDQVLDALAPQRPTGDALLLLARTHPLPPSDVAAWELDSDPRGVATARKDCSRQLAEWGLTDLTFTTELMVSEMVTNAVRYGKPPIRLRLIRDRSLICETHDTSSSAPHVRHAASGDEGGRGLFMLSQMAARWGVRFDPQGTTGKTVWAEQEIPE